MVAYLKWISTQIEIENCNELLQEIACRLWFTLKQIHVHANTVSRIIGKMSIFKTFKQFVTVWQLLRMITQIVASYPFSSISLRISLSTEIVIYNLLLFIGTAIKMKSIENLVFVLNWNPIQIHYPK